LELIGYAILILAGITLALFGGGGSLLTTPVLIYFFHMEPLKATTYALFIVALSSAFGARKVMKSNHIDVFLAIQFAIPCFITIFLIRSLFLPRLPDNFTIFSVYFSRDTVIMIPFGLIMLVSSLKGLIRTKTVKPPKPRGSFTASFQGLLVGCVTGLVGVGGGFLITPILHFVMGLEFKKAVGTSLFVLTLNSSFGFAVDMMSGSQASLYELLLFASISITGLFIGFFISDKLKESKIKLGFSLIILVIALVVLSDYLIRLVQLNENLF
jgi:uncharacterized protein